MRKNTWLKCFVLLVMLMVVGMAMPAGAENAESFTLTASKSTQTIYTEGTSMVTELSVSAQANENATPSGSPSWSMSVVSGDTVNLSLHASDISAMITPNYVTGLGETVVKVECTWMGETASIELTVNVVESPAGAPTGLDLPDEITILPGEQFTLSPSAVLPSGWAVDTHTASLSFSQYYDWTIYSINDGTSDMVLSSSTPGHHLIRVYWQCANFMLYKDILVTVLNEDGSTPARKLFVNSPSPAETTMYLGGSYNGTIAYYSLDRTDLLYHMFDGAPNWSVATVSGDDSFLDVSYQAGNAYMAVYMNGTPAQTGDTVLRFTCTWDDATFTEDFTLHIAQPVMGLPTGLSLPSEMTVMTGESFTLDASIIQPAGWSLENRTPSFSINNASIASTSNDSNGVTTFTAGTPGRYKAIVRMDCANISFEQEMILNITDEEGNVPESEIQLSRDSWTYDLYLGHHYLPSLGNLNIENFYELSTLLGGSPEWSITCLSGDSSLLSHNPYSGSTHVYCANAPTAVGQSVYEIVATWGNISASCILTVNVIDLETEPAGLNYPSEVTVKTGETFTLRKDAILPEGFDFDFSQASITLSGSNASDIYCSFIYDDSYVYTVGTPGVYYMTVNWRYHNISLTDHISVNVADENGVVPAVTVDLNADDAISTTVYLGGNRNYSCHYLSIENVQQLTALYGGSPTWSMTHVSGEEGVLTLEAFDTIAYLTLAQQPTVVGDVVTDITCSWGEASHTIRSTLTVADLGVNAPSGLDLPSEMAVTAGAPFTLPSDYLLPTDIVLPDAIPSLNVYLLGSNSLNADYSGSEPAYTVDTPGMYTLQASWYYSNYYFSHNISLKVADENGVVPSMELELASSEGNESTLFANGNAFPHLTNIYLPDYDNLNQFLEGSPEWTVQVTSGQADLIYHNVYSSDISLYLNAMPTTGDTVLEVTCTWGELSETFIYTVHVVDIGELPTDLDLPDMIEVNAVDFFTLDLSKTLPANITLPLEALGFASYCSVSSDIAWLSSSEDYQLTFKAETPGAAIVSVNARFGNLMLSKNVIVMISDENSHVPMPAMEISPATMNTNAYLGGNSTGTWQVSITNYDALEVLLEGEPQWSYEVLSGEADLISMYDSYDHPGYVDIGYTQQPSVAGDTVVKLTCTWGDLSGSAIYTLHAVELEVTPTGLQEMDEIVVKTGETFTIPVKAYAPANATLPKDESYAANVFAYDDTQFTFVESSAEYLTFRAGAPGIYTPVYQAYFANFYFSQPFVVKVADENGVVPELNIELVADESSDATVFAGSNMYYNLNSVRVNNYDQLYNIYGGSPTWTYEVTGVLDGYLSFRDYASYSRISMTSAPKTAGESTVTVTCTWGDLTASYDMHVNVVEFADGGPQQLSITNPVSAKVGVPFSIDPAIATPDDWMEMEGFTPLAYMSSYSSTDFDTVFTEQGELYTPLKAGYFRVYYNWELGNISLGQEVVLCVADENGNVPAPTPGMQVDQFVDTLYTGGNYNPEVVYIYLENNSLLRALYDTAPVWTCSINGEEDIFTFEYYDSDAWLELDKQPTQPGTYQATITCTWGEITESQTMTIHVADLGENTPAGIDVSTPIQVKAGESFSIPETVLLPANQDFSALTDDVYIDPYFGSDYTYDSTDEGELYTINIPGTYYIRYIWYGGNFHFNECLPVYVSDEDGNVPDFEMELYLSDSEQTLYVGSNQCIAAYYELMDAAFLHSMYGGEPTLTLTFDDPAFVGYVDTYDSYMSEWGDLIVTATPEKAGDYTCTFTIAWGEEIMTQDITLHLVKHPNGVPTGISAPDEITLTSGELYSFPKDCFLPEGWLLEDDYVYIECNSAASVNPMDWYDENDESFIFQATYAGVYQMTLYVDCANFVFEKEFTLTITDKDGALPTEELQLYNSYGDNRKVYLGGNNTLMGRVFIEYDQYQKLAGTMDSSPVWSYSVVEGGMTLNSSVSFDNRYMTFDSPDLGSVGQTTVQVNCTWGELSGSCTFTLEVCPQPETLPTGLNSPESYTVMQGENVIFSKQIILPEGWSLEGEAAEVYISANSGDVLSQMEHVSTTDEALTYKMLTAGTYTVYINWNCANFNLSKECIIYVTDEDGSLPMPALEITSNYEGERNVYLGGQNGFMYDAFIDWDAYQYYANIYDDEPVWTVTTLDGSLPLHIDSSYEDYVSVATSDGYPAKAETVTARLDLFWGEMRASHTFTLNVLPQPEVLPEGVNFPDTLTLALNEAFVIDSGAVLPAGWALEGETMNYFISAPFATWDVLAWQETPDDSLSYAFTVPGIYTINIWWECANFSYSKDCTFYVKDEDGNLPMPEIQLDAYGYATHYLTGSTFPPFSFYIVNYHELSGTLDGEPVWTFEQLYQTAISYYINQSGDTAHVYIPADCTATGTLALKATVTWGGASASKIYLLDVKALPNGMPTGLKLDDGPYIFKLGESLTLSNPTFLPEGWALDGVDEYLQCWQADSNDGLHITTSDNGITFTASAAGNYRVGISRYAETIDCTAFVYVIVTDANGNYVAPLPKPDVFITPIDGHCVAGKGFPLSYTITDVCGTPASTVLTISRDGEVVHTISEGLPVDLNDPSFDVALDAGVYDLTITVTDRLGQSASYTITLPVAQASDLALNGVRLGQRTTSMLDCSISYSGGTDNVKITSQLFKEGSDTPLETQTGHNSLTYFYPTEEGRYRAHVTITDGITTLEMDSNWLTFTQNPFASMRENFLTMHKGTTYTLSWITSEDIADMSWFIGDERIATVDEAGFITAHGVGRTSLMVTFTLADGTAFTSSTYVLVEDMNTMTLPAALRSIEAQAFLGTSAGRIVIPSGAASIGSKAFADSNTLRLVVIPASVTSIASDILSDSTRASIVCEIGSAAEDFAKANNISYHYYQP